MPNTRLRDAVSALALAACLYSSSALAQYLVFDPTNFSQTTVSAVQNVLSVTKQISQYELQLQQYLTQLTQLKNLPAAVQGMSIGQLTGQISQIQGYVTSLTNLAGSIQGVKSNFDQRLSQAAALGQTYDQFMAMRIANARTNGANAAGLFKTEIDNINSLQNFFKATKAMQDQIPQTEGMHQDMMLMNSQMNQLLAQTADMQQRAILQSQQALERQAMSAGVDQASTQQFYNFTNAQQRLNQRSVSDTSTYKSAPIFK